MSKNVMQVQKSFIVASLFWLFITAMMSFVGILILSDNPTLKSKDILNYLLSNYSYVGLRGMIMAGIMAMIMSTADSFINSTSVLIVNDLFKPLKIKLSDNNLFVAKISSLIIAILSIILALTGGDNLIKLVMSTQAFYMPMVSVTFVMAVMGFRTTSKAVLISMACAFVSIIALKISKADTILVLFLSMFVGIVTLLASHYLLKQPGGWVGIKDYTLVNTLRKKRKNYIRNFFNNASDFSFYNFCKKSTIFDPSVYVVLSLFSMITTYCLTFTLPANVSHQYAALIDVIYPSMLFMASVLMTYPLWPSFFRKEITIIAIWNIAIFYMMVCAPFIFVLISEFASTQLSVFMINLIIISVLIRWQLAMLMILGGIILTFAMIKVYLGNSDAYTAITVIEFKMSFLLLTISGALIAFLKPKQEYHQLVEQQVEERTKELKQALEVKKEFLDNVSHEIKTPVHNITNIINELCDQWQEITDYKKREFVELLKTCNEKLFALCSNLLDLSKLGKRESMLEIKSYAIKNLVDEVVAEYNHSSNKILVKSSIDSNIIIACDFYKISQVIRNLIDNAIKYGQGSEIVILIDIKKGVLTIAVADQGIGIDLADMDKIFQPFEQGLRTKTNAGGTGLGLSICKKIVEMHQGAIWVENNKLKGSIFYFTLPQGG
jgi:signal transduction histidine kinase